MQTKNPIVSIFEYIVDISRLQILCENQTFMNYNLRFLISVFNLG